MMQELIIRILQGRKQGTVHPAISKLSNNNRFQFIINYIRDNIRESLSVEQLGEKSPYE